MQSLEIQHVSGDEVNVLEEALFVEKQVVDPRFVPCLNQLVRQPAADVSGSPYNEDALHHYPSPARFRIPLRQCISVWELAQEGVEMVNDPHR